ncbi:hypothetical protein [Aurantimonas endophytica]
MATDENAETTAGEAFDKAKRCLEMKSAFGKAPPASEVAAA